MVMWSDENAKEGVYMKKIGVRKLNMNRLAGKIVISFLSLSLLSGCGASGETQTLETETEPLVVEAVDTTETEGTAQTETVSKEDVALADGITIQKSSKWISNRLANKAFEDIRGQITASNEGISQCENFTLVISSEKKKDDGLIWEKLWVYYDLIMVREPEENPFLLGMKEGRDSLSDADEIAYADEEIDGWYKELEGNFQQQNEEPNMWQQMWLAYDPDGEEYTIYCESSVDGNYELVILEEYMKERTEDYDLEKIKGKEYILEEVTRLKQAQ